MGKGSDTSVRRFAGNPLGIPRMLEVLVVMTMATAIATGARMPQAQAKELVYSKQPHMQVYTAKLSDVWRALQKVMADYPLNTNSIDQALMETNDLSYRQHWPAFYNLEAKKSQQGDYRLKIQVVKAPAPAKNKVQVWIKKSVFKKTDFFSGPKALPSDGMEELALFYRLEREIYLNKLTRPSQ